MRLGLTITQRYLVFTAAVIILFIISTQIITSRVVRSGLEEVFRQRFDRAQVVMDQYETVHRLAKTTELESVLNSPRFIAAVETEDSATISAELPIYQRVLGAGVVALADRQGNLVYASDSIRAMAQEQVSALLRTNHPGITVQYLEAPSMVLELLISPITNSSGNVIGTIAEGSRMSATLPDDLKKLTGFDVIISHDGHVLGTTRSPLVESIMSSPERIARVSSEATRMGEIPDASDALIFSSLRISQSPALVTFVASLDEHIAPIRREITMYLVLLAVIGGLVSTGVIYWFVSRQIGRQIGALVQSAEAIAAGNLDTRVESLDNDELGYLAGEFDKMRNRLIRSRRELEEAHSGALASERLAAIGKLATGIIHDFKNPMAVIRGTVDLINAREKENEKLKRYCSTIHDQVDRMVDLTRD
ncbi:MAG: HAMP domain-containing protein, partial [Candidatus Zixiibacteriota bacterium]